MEDELEPGIDRYLTTLRRFWWMIPLGAVLVAVVFVGMASSGYRQSARLLIPTSSPALLAGDFATPPLDLTAPVYGPLDQLDDRTTEQELSAAAGSPVVVGVSGTPAIGTSVFTATVHVDGEDSAAVSQALEMAAQRLLDGYVTNATRDAGIAKSGLEAAATTTEERLAELETQLGAVPDRDSPLAESLRIELSKRADELLGTRIRITALDEFTTSVGSTVDLVSDPEPVSTGSTLVRAVLGLVLGALLALGALMVYALVRRRVGSRRDVTRLGAGPLVATIVKGRDRPRSIAAAAAALAHLSSRTGAPEVAIASVDDRVGLEQLGSDLTADLTRQGLTGVAIRPVGNVLADVEAFSAAARSSVVVLAVGYGRTMEADIVRAANELTTAGVELGGSVLVGVPASAARSTAL